MLPIRHREQPLRAVALALERLREVDLVELAHRAERFHTVNNTYEGFTLSAAEQQSPRDGAAHYTVAVLGLSGSSFTLTATPVDAQRSDTCGTLTLTASGSRSASGGSAEKCF